MIHADNVSHINLIIINYIIDWLPERGKCFAAQRYANLPSLRFVIPDAKKKRRKKKKEESKKKRKKKRERERERIAPFVNVDRVKCGALTTTCRRIFRN